jgi:YD repeat-containing protein
MVESSGTTVLTTLNYQYDAAGELTVLSDGSGKTIAAYTYNSLGQLVRQALANGAFTTYQYDADGNLLHLVNEVPSTSGATVSSRFDYTYDELGNVTT